MLDQFSTIELLEIRNALQSAHQSGYHKKRSIELAISLLEELIMERGGK